MMGVGEAATQRRNTAPAERDSSSLSYNLSNVEKVK